MDANRFDALTKSLGAQRTRRGLLGALAGTALAALGLGGRADARTCRSVGNTCSVDGNCCSGLCVVERRTRKLCHCTSPGDCPPAPNACFTAGGCLAGACAAPSYNGAGAACPGGVCFNQACCVPVAKTTTCAGTCGPQTDNCGQSARCDPCCTATGDACGSASCCSGACCGGACVDPASYATDPSNCGGCDAPCASGACLNGGCVVCNPGAVQACYSGPPATRNIGVCTDGRQTCLNDGSGYGSCQSEVLPSAETCNGQDDDCDGTVDNGAGCGMGFACTNGQCVSTGGGGGGCFAAGARVTMADGSTKAVEDVAVGDLVQGLGGAANRVIRVEMPLLGSRPLYAINGGPFFVTASHPFHTPGGLKSFDPDATAREPRQLRVDALTTGDEIVGDWAARNARDENEDETRFAGHRLVTVESIESSLFALETVLYNLIVSGDGSHNVGGLYLVNK